MLVPDRDYSGPFADEAEHIFYTNIPNLSQFAASPAKTAKTARPPKVETVERELIELDDDIDDETPPFGDDDTDETGETGETEKPEVVESKEERLMKELLEVNSAETVDKVGVSLGFQVVVHGVLRVELASEPEPAAADDSAVVRSAYGAAPLLRARDSRDSPAVRVAEQRGGEERACRKKERRD